MKKKLLLILLSFWMCMFISANAEAAGNDSEVVATAEVISGGDLLISDSILAGAKTDSGSYDFNYIFQYVDDYIEAADYAVINLETAIAGEAKGYCGFPKFNTPGSIVTAAQNAGFDMFLTASNHSYDWSLSGLKNKVSWLQQKDVDYIGTRKDTDEYYHRVIDVNGIKIGMLNYTQVTGKSTKEKVILNATRTGEDGAYEYVIVGKKGQERIAYYNKNYLSEFYSTLKKDIKSLKNRGAQIIVAYPHWGQEYNIGYNSTEDKIAQKMCDLGVDVIIGGHPHVVEPVKVYTSKVSGKTTVCIHSTGNFVSSMRRTQKKTNPDYVEDGALFKYTVKEYADGTAAVTAAEVLPIWVKKADNAKRYTVIPLDKDVDWKESFGVANYSENASNGYQSYERTMDLVSKGIKKFNGMAKITKQPTAKSVKTGKNVKFTLQAVGNNISYQWQFSSDGGETWTNSTGKGNQINTLTVKAKKSYNGKLYRCKVKTSAGTVYSKKVKLTVKE